MVERPALRPDPRAVAVAVCSVMGGEPAALLASSRGTPADAERRWVAMHVWRSMSWPQPSLTEVGAAFGRDRSTVAAGLEHVRAMWRAGRLSGRLQRIRKRLREGE